MNRIPRRFILSGSRRLEQELFRKPVLIQTSSLSTFEHMYDKLVSLPPVHYIEDTLAHIHDVSGIPWCGTIVVCTAALRLLLTLPAQTTAQKVASKRYLLFKEMENEIIPALRQATDMQVVRNQWSKEKATNSFNRVASQIKSQKVIEYNCHMSKLFLPLYIQIPVWVFTSVGIRNLALMRETAERLQTVPVEERFLQLTTEGALWFPNLTIPDQSLLLPLLVGTSFAVNIFVSSSRLKAGAEVSRWSRAVTYFLYSLAVLMVPLAAIQPSALALYWATSGVVGVAINLILLSPTYRGIVRIPRIPKDSDTPYRDVKYKILSLFSRTKET